MKSLDLPRSYREAEERLLSFVNYEEKTHYRYDTTTHDLVRFESLLRRLGSPHRAVPALHVAGTNGKGSISTLLAGILRESGLSVGHYTSPHLLEMRERIAIDGAPVAPERFTALAARILEQDPDAAPAVGFRTTFEILTAMAFLAFAESKVDCAVVEVGLGGRLDATNVLAPDVALFGHIAIDHQDVLGDSLYGIAEDKAAILKEGGRGVSGPQDQDARAALEARARQVGAPLAFASDASEWALRDLSPRGQTFDIRAPWGEWEDLSSPLLGRHQIENVRVVLRAVHELRGKGAAIPDRAIRNALEKARLPGRFDAYPGRPSIVLDGAHNPDAARNLRDTLDAVFPDAPRWFVVGMAANKDRPGFLRSLLHEEDGLIVTKAASPRASEPVDLRTFAETLGVRVEERPDLRSAVTRALSRAPQDAVLCVTGSFVLVGEAYGILERIGEREAAFRVGD